VSETATVPLVVGTIAVVGVGAVVTQHKVNAKALMAGGILALGLSAIANADEKLAQVFAGLIFLGACYTFVPDIVTALGLSGGRSGNDIDLSKAAARQSKTTPAAPAVAPALLGQRGGGTANEQGIWA